MRACTAHQRCQRAKRNARVARPVWEAFSVASTPTPCATAQTPHAAMAGAAQRNSARVLMVSVQRGTYAAFFFLQGVSVMPGAGGRRGRLLAGSQRGVLQFSARGYGKRRARSRLANGALQGRTEVTLLLLMRAPRPQVRQEHRALSVTVTAAAASGVAC